MRGPAAGLSFCWLTASANSTARVREDFLADLCTVLPYYLERYFPRTEALELGRAAGALQALVDGLLDPFARTLTSIRLEGAGRFDQKPACSRVLVRRQAGARARKSRAFCHAGSGPRIIRDWCEGGDSNPHGGYPLEPKSSASTSSATFASGALHGPVRRANYRESATQGPPGPRWPGYPGGPVASGVPRLVT